MPDIVSFSREDRIGIITIDNPPVNALSQAVRQGLLDAIGKAVADPEVGIIVLLCAGRTFIAGADINEFSKPPMAPDFNVVLAALENSPRPVVAAIHGSALGGGFETALACHFRCAIPSAKVGLPEVTLGLIPGAGGTQRLPRLIGIESALERIVSGKPWSAGDAHRAGAIDRIIEGNLRSGAIAWAGSLLTEGAGPQRVRDRAIDPGSVPGGFFDRFRATIAPRTRGQFAPERAIRAVEAAVSLPFDRGLVRERELFDECLKSPESAALRHLFFAERQAIRIPDVPKETSIRPIQKIGIVGAGTMGGGIAMSMANAGLPVVLAEVERSALDHGLDVIRDNYRRSVDRGRLSAEEMDHRMAAITGTLDLAEFGDVDLAIEAVFEDFDVKREVFTKLDGVLKQGAILASNTSYLDINALAATTSRPSDILGLHFFSPANVMRLLEVVRGEKTGKDVLATCMKLARTIRKLPVVAGVCVGFIGNRMLQGYFRESRLAAYRGAALQEIDAALFNFGMSMGPYAVSDMAGLDVGYRARRAIPGLSPSEREDPVVDRLVEAGRLGQKTGRGFFRYEKGSRTPIPDPEVEAMFREAAESLGIDRRPIDAEEIVFRCLCALVNEGARILEEGIALRPGDIDLVWINGYGFPPHRGGPMFHAERLGLTVILDRIRSYHEESGLQHWKPSALLERLAGEGKGFSSLP